MRRILMVLTVALILTLMLTAPSVAKNGATVDHDAQCAIGSTKADRCQLVATPSGRLNGNAHVRPQRTTSPSEYDGAVVEHEGVCRFPNTDPPTNSTSCQAVGTPSEGGNLNAHFNPQRQ